MVKLVYIVILVIALMGVFGAHLAYATNESSYKEGVKTGFEEYSMCVKPGSTDCDNPPSHIDYPDAACAVTGGGWVVTNATACTDGYVHGFQTWCAKYTNACADMIVKDTFPGSLLTDLQHRK
jgi:hypothetical protein